MKEYFLVGAIRNEISIEVMGIARTVPLKWADGMTGAMPVFDTIEQAKEYKGDTEATIMVVREPAEGNNQKVALLTKKHKEADEFIMAIADMLGFDSGELGFDGISLSLDDIKERIDFIKSNPPVES